MLKSISYLVLFCIMLSIASAFTINQFNDTTGEQNLYYNSSLNNYTRFVAIHGNFTNSLYAYLNVSGLPFLNNFDTINKPAFISEGLKAVTRNDTSIWFLTWNETIPNTLGFYEYYTNGTLRTNFSITDTSIEISDSPRQTPFIMADGKLVVGSRAYSISSPPYSIHIYYPNGTIFAQSSGSQSISSNVIRRPLAFIEDKTNKRVFVTNNRGAFAEELANVRVLNMSSGQFLCNTQCGIANCLNEQQERVYLNITLVNNTNVINGLLNPMQGFYYNNLLFLNTNSTPNTFYGYDYEKKYCFSAGGYMMNTTGHTITFSPGTLGTDEVISQYDDQKLYIVSNSTQSDQTSYKVINMTYISNLTIYVNNSLVLNVTGNYKTTNITSNFSSQLKSYLASCSLAGNKCVIPFFFNANGNGNLRVSDLNINVFELVSPQLTLIEPNRQYTNVSTINLNFSVSDNVEVDKCWFNVSLISGQTMVSTTFINCSITNTTFTLPISGSNAFNITLCSNDTSANLNCTRSNFTTLDYVAPIIIQGGGGGGSAQLPINVSILSTSYGNKIDLVLAKDSVKPRVKQILVLNYESSPVQVTLRCEPTNYSSLTEANICDYVNFSATTFEVSPNELEPSYVNVEINTPEGADYGDNYNFNILGETTGYTLADPKISASARITFYALAFKYSLVPFQEGETYTYPVFPIAFIIAFIIFVGFYFALRKLKFTSVFVSTIMFVLTFALLLYLL